MPMPIGNSNTIVTPLGKNNANVVLPLQPLSEGLEVLSVNGRSGYVILSPSDVGNTTAVWNANGIQGISVSPTPPSAGQTLEFNGSEYAPTTPISAPVLSVFGRTGTVTAQAGDYTYSQVGADQAGAAATVQGNLTTHAGLTTTAHGGIVPSSRQVNGKALSSDVTLTTADVADSTDKRYVTDAQKTVLGNTSGTNTGDQTITLTSDVTGSGAGSFATTIANNAVTNAKAAQMGAYTIKGNNTASTANAADLSTSQVVTLLNLGTAAFIAKPSGTSSQMLGQDGSGNFSNVTIGTGLQLSSGTLSNTVTAPIGANPTATVSGTATNGSATTFMRSDAAPALSTTAVTAGSYTHTSLTVDANGRLTAAASATNATALNAVSGTNTGDQTLTSLGAQGVFNGIVDATKFSVAYSASTRIFSVTYSSGAAVWVNGAQYAFSAGTVTTTAHANTSGLWFLYYNSSGVLTVSSTAWDIINNAPLALIYYYSSGPAAIMYYEKHSSPNGETAEMHKYLHFTRGTQADSSSAFTVGNYTLNTDNTIAYSVGGGYIWDEDIQHNLPGITAGGTYPIFYRTGSDASNLWTWDLTSTNGLLGNGTDPYYNQLSGGSWSNTAVSSNNIWFNYYIVATPARALDDSAYSNSIIAVMGQNTYTSLASAQAESPANISWGLMPFAEFVILAQVTYRRGNGYTPIHSHIAAVTTLRYNNVSAVSALTSISAASVSVATASFNKNLSSADSNAQHALETIDQMTAINGVTLTPQSTGFTVAGGTTSKTLTVALDANVSGTNTGNETTASIQTLLTNAFTFDGTTGRITGIKILAGGSNYTYTFNSDGSMSLAQG